MRIKMLRTEPGTSKCWAKVSYENDDDDGYYCVDREDTYPASCVEDWGLLQSQRDMSQVSSDMNMLTLPNGEIWASAC